MKNEEARILSLDVLRGLAICGIVFANIPTLLEVDWGGYKGRFWDYFLFYEQYFKQRFFPLFSMLFGLSFTLIWENLAAKGQKPLYFLVRRLLILILVGIVHTYFHPGEALTLYGVLGFSLLFINYLDYKFSAFLAFILLVLAFTVSGKHGMVLAMFSLGAAIGKSGVMSRLEAFRGGWWWMTGVCVLIGYFLLPFQLESREYWYGGKISLLGGFVLMWGYISAVLGLYFVLPKNVFFPLACLGRMALTNYILQTVIVLVLGQIFQWKGVFLLSHVHYLALGILAFQLVYSTLWFNYFNYGPLEWLLRRGTYYKMAPPENFKKIQVYS